MGSSGPNRVVELNIGGTLYSTTVATLLNQRHTESVRGGAKLNFFAKLLAKEAAAREEDSGDEESAAPATGAAVLRDSAGRLFVDREGKYFAPILEYLRTGVLTVPRDMAIDALFREAAHYGIPLPLCSGTRVEDNTLNEDATVTPAPLPLLVNNRFLQRECASMQASLSVAGSIGRALLDTILTQFEVASSTGGNVQTGWIMERQPPNFADAKFDSIAARVLQKAKKTGEELDFAVKELVEDLVIAYSKVEKTAVQRSSYYKYINDADRRKELITYCKARDLDIVVKEFTIVVFFNLGEGKFRAASWSQEYYNANQKKVHAKVAMATSSTGALASSSSIPSALIAND
eukprot:CAMPEP_0114620858 /NCGR_PEP_ID=MMETSP0168-20121206/8938_1 /TAXON_ID=95228 ORGANISM="Vannella sp., Strain DIVA3 517/6/12" /NCGR_SAMPLE_ID=MMETSP0168 /ASSEMBLY_ACC=CAM_ASM_000044 /LENGTH=347 /DNA_ID=CAMNT_0001832055 /DNA_START=68 /DNA_END=1109 /DNA_ORIENTATION=-